MQLLLVEARYYDQCAIPAKMAAISIIMGDGV